MADVFEDRRELDPWRDKLWELITQTPQLDWQLLTKRPENIGKLSPWKRDFPPNIWLGTTVENQNRAEERILELIKYPATVRFLSCEPLLGYIDLSPWQDDIDWVIVGGESGNQKHSIRPMHQAWVSSILSDCQIFKIPFFFKQWGSWKQIKKPKHLSGDIIKIVDEYTQEIAYMKWGKKGKNGRKFQGRYWNEFPKSQF